VYWKNKQLETTANSTINSCLSCVRSARDRHEQNVELVHKEDFYYVRTIRPIRRGEQLLIWYEESHAREVGVPILTLSHIRGHQNYMCTSCGVTFTHPNILKAHIFYHCSTCTPTPSATARSLVPFQQLLQTISKTPAYGDICDLRKSARRDVSPRPHHPLNQSEVVDQDSSYRSAFRTYPASSRDAAKGPDDALMTPDSSTDQSSALNLSVKHVSRIKAAGEPASSGIPSWNFIDSQALMPPVPRDYQALGRCYPIAPHFHPMDLKMFNGQASVASSQTYHTLMESRSGCRADYTLPPSQVDHFQERKANPHTSSSLSPTASSYRSANPYSFTLPSDKEPLDLLPQAYFANKSKKGHLCLCCGKLYSRKYGLKIHMRTHNGYKPLKCKICSRPFGDPSNLNKHVRLHAQGETPYRCEYCGKVLVRRRDLERHVRSRHPMGCADNDDVLCESSPDSSPISVSGESPDDLHRPKQTSLNGSVSS
ncbi:hypothetical protein Btru_000295, partial [Bulinus truncatus]